LAPEHIPAADHLLREFVIQVSRGGKNPSSSYHNSDIFFLSESIFFEKNSIFLFTAIIFLLKTIIFLMKNPSKPTCPIKIQASREGACLFLHRFFVGK
jgi:hypothetical protein